MWMSLGLIFFYARGEVDTCGLWVLTQEQRSVAMASLMWWAES